jgi:hypothetical protein
LILKVFPLDPRFTLSYINSEKKNLRRFMIRPDFFLPVFGLKGMMKKNALVWMVTAVQAFLLFSCAGPKEIRAPRSIGAWVVYWDGERGLKELETHGGLFDRVSLFAYELEEGGRPQSAPGLERLIPVFHRLAQERGFSPWVTLVNDMRGSQGVRLKETETLRRLLSDPEGLRRHVADIVSLVEKDGFAGLDLDYEGFSTDDRAVLDPLITALSLTLKERGLGFQVVVEPRKDRYLPPAGCAPVVVMGYNLHGPHSGPGPRSTPTFIRSLAPRGQGDPSGEAAVALAVGGFVWGKDRKVKQLDWITGKAWGEKAREKGRGEGEVPFARMEDGSLLWYEDEQSLALKWAAAAEDFRRLMVWRLGGNDEGLFAALKKIRGRARGER